MNAYVVEIVMVRKVHYNIHVRVRCARYVGLIVMMNTCAAVTSSTGAKGSAQAMPVSMEVRDNRLSAKSTYLKVESEVVCGSPVGGLESVTMPYWGWVRRGSFHRLPFKKIFIDSSLVILKHINIFLDLTFLLNQCRIGDSQTSNLYTSRLRTLFAFGFTFSRSIRVRSV